MKLKYVLLATVLLAVPAVATEPSHDDSTLVKQTLINFYEAFSGFDEQRYRALCTDDYVLLEDGEIWNLDKDVAAFMSQAASGRKRSDTFDFLVIKIQGNTAYAVFFLKSEIMNKGEVQHRQWLESAVLLKSDRSWRVSLLHSTKLGKP